MSPDYAYRILSSSVSSVGNFISDYRNENEQPIIGYTTGLNFVSNITERFGIGTGIHFSKKGYKSENGLSGLIFGDMIDSRRGFFYPGGFAPENITYVYNHYYIGVPLKAILTFGKREVKFITSGGFTTNIMLKSSTKTVIDYADGSSDNSVNSSTNSYRRIDLSPEISVGVQKKVKDKFTFRLDPTLRYGALSVISAPVTANLWSAGLNISCYLDLK